MPLAFVPQYCWDVFISYAGLDDNKKWVSSFTREFTDTLALRLGCPVHVWLDKDRLKPGYVIDEKIQYDLSRTAVFIRLCSPAYNESEWCPSELQWFQAPINPLDDLVLESRSRIITVSIRNDPAQPLPSETLFTSFHDAKRTFEPGTPEFATELDRLAEAVDELLRLMWSKREPVFVPRAGPSSQAARQTVTAELHAAGYRAISVSTPQDRERYSMAVFLLARDYVPSLRAELRDVIALKKPVIVWIDPRGDMDERQATFADELTRQLSGDHIRESLSELTRMIGERLKKGFKESIATRVEEATQAMAGARQVVLLAQPADRPLAKKFIEQGGFSVVEAKPGSSVSEHRTLEIANMRNADRVLLFAQTEGVHWMRSQLYKLRQYPSNADLKAAVMLLDPPQKPRMIEHARAEGFEETSPQRRLIIVNGPIQPDWIQFFSEPDAGAAG